jgi:hypothetical protein
MREEAHVQIWPFRRKVTKADVTPSATQPSEQVLSLLSPDEVHSLGGLPVEGIAGRFESESMSVATFRQNPAFVEFMHQVIRTAGPKDPGLQAAAQGQREGWVYIIDLRTPEGPSGRVPPEDIIGAFEVRDGRIMADSYQPNSEHGVYTEDGLVRLPPFLRRALVERLPKVS